MSDKNEGGQEGHQLAPLQELFSKAVTLHQAGKSEQAVRLYQTVLEKKPDFAEAHYNLGNTLTNLGQLEEAVASYSKAIELNSDLAGAHNNLGNALSDLGRLEEAVTCYRKAVALNPDNAGAYFSLGNALKSLRRLKEAVATYNEAIALKPDFAGAHYNRGIALLDMDRLKEAVASFRNARALEPDRAAVHNMLGRAFKNLGQLEEAAASYRKVIALKPNQPGAYNVLGTVLSELGQLEEAVASYRKVIELKPDHAFAHGNLGNALRDLGRLEEAIASYREAIALNPDHPGSYSNLGNALKDLGRLEEAVASCRKAIALRPDYFFAHSNLIYGLKLMADTPSSEIKAEAERFGDCVRSRAQPFSDWNVQRDPAKRLRVGFVSGDFRNHVVARYLESFLGHIDRSRLELVAYSNGAREDQVTTRLKSHFDLWRKVVGLDDRSLAGLIHDDAVDILIDLSGHSGDNRLPMFAYKPAPVQASWLGLFVTTGVPGMDYIIADPYLVPGDEAQYFTEEIWPLPESWFCLRAHNVAVEPGPLPALTNAALTFGCFNNLAKVTDVVVALWARVLLAVPGSRLFLKNQQMRDDMARQNTLARFAVHGIGPERLVLEESSPVPDYLAAYNRVDVALDPFPFTGATTTLDSLWMGVPVLTRRGERVGSHLGESIAQVAGLGDWIADDDEDYVTKAIALTSDLNRLVKLRANLRERVLASSLYDGARFARHFESALREMWQRAS